MTRKHFVALAEAIHTITDGEERENVARLIADVCRASNPQFDYSRFYTACGV